MLTVKGDDSVLEIGGSACSKMGFDLSEGYIEVLHVDVVLLRIDVGESGGNDCYCNTVSYCRE